MQCLFINLFITYIYIVFVFFYEQNTQHKSQVLSITYTKQLCYWMFWIFDKRNNTNKISLFGIVFAELSMPPDKLSPVNCGKLAPNSILPTMRLPPPPLLSVSWRFGHAPGWTAASTQCDATTPRNSSRATNDRFITTHVAEPSTMEFFRSVQLIWNSSNSFRPSKRCTTDAMGMISNGVSVGEFSLRTWRASKSWIVWNKERPAMASRNSPIWLRPSLASTKVWMSAHHQSRMSCVILWRLFPTNYCRNHLIGAKRILSRRWCN